MSGARIKLIWKGSEVRTRAIRWKPERDRFQFSKGELSRSESFISGGVSRQLAGKSIPE